MQLFATEGSLYSAKVRIALRVKGLQWVEAEPPGGYGSEAYRKIVAQGTVPALKVGDAIIIDSEAIIEYLEEAFPSPSLLHGDSIARARLRSLSRFHDTVLEPALRSFFPLVKKPEGSMTDRIARLNQHIVVFAGIAEASPFLAGDAMSLPDCGYPLTLDAIKIVARKLRFELEWPDNVARYAAALEEVPAVRDVLMPFRTATYKWAGLIPLETE